MSYFNDRASTIRLHQFYDKQVRLKEEMEWAKKGPQFKFSTVKSSPVFFVEY